jgi:(p)ppGpp synthase/HD superfamily hydrolase
MPPILTPFPVHEESEEFDRCWTMSGVTEARRGENMDYMKNIKKPESVNFLHLTARFTHAIDYARQLHVNYRKGTCVPYMAHLLGVASLVMGESGHVSFSVTEDMVIGALLHDAVEDEGGLPRLRDIEVNFGNEVAKIVEGCTDSFEEDSSRKLEWEVRKKSYIDRLRREPGGTLLVSAADKLYNARAILEDYRSVGLEVWSRFRRGRKEQLWYFDELIKIYEQRCPNWRIVSELKRVIGDLARLSAGEP